MRLLSAPCVTNLVLVGKGKVHIVCLSSMAGDNDGIQATSPQFFLQHRQRADGQFVVLCQHIDETPAAIRPKPDSIPSEKVTIINEIYQMPPGVARNKETLDFYIPNRENLTGFQIKVSQLAVL